MDVNRAADLYGQGWTLRQIGAELGVPWTGWRLVDDDSQQLLYLTLER